MSRREPSIRFLRHQGEAVDELDYRRQSADFIRICFEEGLGLDETIIAARQHAPTRENFGSGTFLDSWVER
jgi:hypothetical protein